MRSASLLLLCLGLGAAAAALADPGLAGAWQLVSVDTVRPNGEIIHPFYGEHPQGLIVYDRSGWMAVQIVSDPKPMVPRGDSRDAFRNAPAAEKAAAADGYYAYFGPYTVDERASTVTHHLREALYPGERGGDVVRHYAINGDLLTLVAKVHEMGEDRERRLSWRRLPVAAK
jgi:hypothetical protein